MVQTRTYNLRNNKRDDSGKGAGGPKDGKPRRTFSLSNYAQKEIEKNKSEKPAPPVQDEQKKEIATGSIPTDGNLSQTDLVQQGLNLVTGNEPENAKPDETPQQFKQLFKTDVSSLPVKDVQGNDVPLSVTQTAKGPEQKGFADKLIEPVLSADQNINKGFEKLNSGNPKGVFNILNGIIGGTALPFTTFDTVLRQVPEVGDVIADIIGSPGKLVEQTYPIVKGAIQPGNTTVNAVTNLLKKKYNIQDDDPAIDEFAQNILTLASYSGVFGLGTKFKGAELKTKINEVISTNKNIEVLEQDKKSVEENISNAKTPQERLQAIGLSEQIQDKLNTLQEKKKEYEAPPTLVNQPHTVENKPDIELSSKTYQNAIDLYDKELHGLEKQLQDKELTSNKLTEIEKQYKETEQRKKFWLDKQAELLPKNSDIKVVENKSRTEPVSSQESVKTEKSVKPVENKQVELSSEKQLPPKQKVDEFKQTLVNIANTGDGISAEGILKARELSEQSKDLFSDEQRSSINNFIKDLDTKLKEKPVSEKVTTQKQITENLRKRKSEKEVSKENTSEAKQELVKLGVNESELKDLSDSQLMKRLYDEKNSSKELSASVKTPEQHIVESPRSELPGFISDKIKDDAEQKLSRIEGSEVKRVGSWNTADNVTGESKGTAPFTVSSFPKWFSDLGSNKKSVVTALQKIIEDNGKDKGVMVERIKEKILQHLTEGQSELENSTLSVIGGESRRNKSTAIPKDEEVSAYLDQFKNNKVTLEDLHTAENELTSFNPESFDKKPFDRSQLSQQGIPIGKEQIGKFYESDIKPKLVGALRLADSIKKTFSPSTRGEYARETAKELRHMGGKLARQDEMIFSSLDDARKVLDKNSNKANLDLIDTAETGKTFADPVSQRFFDNMQKMLSDRWKKIQEAKGTEAFIENYFPHIWKDPANVKSEFQKIYGNRPFQGSKSFLKQRTIPTTKDGIKAGLEPVSYNPVELAMAKLHEMNKFILAQETFKKFKESGLIKFHKNFKDVPEGWVKLDDKIATVFGDPNISIPEYVDKKLYDDLISFAKDIGIRHERLSKLEGGVLGKAYKNSSLGQTAKSPSLIQTRFATGEDTLAHEIGHQLEWKYNLWDHLTSNIEGIGKQGRVTKKASQQERVKIHKEIRNIADLRAEDESISESRRRYLRDKDEKMAAILQAYIHTPDKFKKVAPTVFTNFEQFLDSNPELKQVKDIKSSLVHKELSNKFNVGGTIIRGYYYAPEQAATVFNNHLSPGLKGKTGFELIRQSGNLLNQVQLGLSAFHLSFTSLDSTISRFALGLKKISKGKPVQGLKDIVTSPVAPVTNFLRGNKLFKDYQQEIPTDPALVKAVEEAGGRIKMDKFYINNAVKNFTNAMKDNNYLSALFKLPGATAELISKPIMEIVVPRQKLGVFSDMAKDILQDFDQGKLTENQKVKKLQTAWESVDNRMGQLVYDNLFWNRTVKDLGLASVRSLGWNLGTVREVGGGLVDIPKYAKQLVTGKEGSSRFEITDRMAYIAALPIVVGSMGAVMNYLWTGKAPQETKDYFFPRTGKKKPDGSDERVSLPSYIKDLFAYAEDPILTASHKIHPVFGVIAQMLDNKDYFGYEIRDKNDTYLEQGKQVLNYLGEQYKPFSVRNLEQRKKAGDSFVDQMQSFVGITPAAKYITNTEVQNKIEKRFNEIYGNQTKTLDQKEKDETKRRLKELYNSDPEEYEKQSQEALESGTLTKRMIESIEDKIPTDIKLFKRLPKTDKEILRKEMSEDQISRYFYGNGDEKANLTAQANELQNKIDDVRNKYSNEKNEDEKERLRKEAQELKTKLDELKENPILKEKQKKSSNKTKETNELNKKLFKTKQKSSF